MKMRTAVAVMSLTLMAAMVGAAGIGPPHPAFYVDDEIFYTVGTPNSLPDQGPKDGLYVITGLSGQTPVAEAKPGDQDYNGGRWQVTVLAFTESGIAAHDPDGDGMVNFELTNWEQVEHHINVLGHLEVVGPGPSFTCPVIPRT